MITSCRMKEAQETSVTVTSAIVTSLDLERIRLRSTGFVDTTKNTWEKVIHVWLINMLTRTYNERFSTG